MFAQERCLHANGTLKMQCLYVSVHLQEVSSYRRFDCILRNLLRSFWYWWTTCTWTLPLGGKLPNQNKYWEQKMATFFCNRPIALKHADNIHVISTTKFETKQLLENLKFEIETNQIIPWVPEAFLVSSFKSLLWPTRKASGGGRYCFDNAEPMANLPLIAA